MVNPMQVKPADSEGKAGVGLLLCVCLSTCAFGHVNFQISLSSIDHCFTIFQQ